MKTLASLLFLVASLALVGCGADTGTTAEQEAAFKKGDKSAVKGPPPGANQRPATFHSSVDDLPGNSKAPAGSGVPSGGK